MKITKKWLQNNRACVPIEEMRKAEKELKGDIFKIIPALMDLDRFSDANWLITRVMNKKQKVQYAIFSAEQAIDIYEKKYPNNKAPRLAIKAAKNYLKNPCKQTKEAADVAGTSACAASANAYASYSAFVYTSASAASAAFAAYTAYTADPTYAAYAALTAADVKKEFKIKIINKGLKILTNKKRI